MALPNPMSLRPVLLWQNPKFGPDYSAFITILSSVLHTSYDVFAYL
jgi:hypothetical protein